MTGESQGFSQRREERRRAPRAKYSILANYMVGSKVYSDYIQNISMDGASIRSSQAMSFHVGQPIFIAFASVNSQRQIEGEIAWISPNAFGVAFKNVSMKSKELNLYESELKESDRGFVKEEPKRTGRIRKIRVRWEPSPSEHATRYRLYWSKEGDPNYDSDHADLGHVTQVVLPDDVPSFPLIAGDMRIGVTVLNEAGNESAMTTATVRIDFTVPDPPKNIKVEEAS